MKLVSSRSPFKACCTESEMIRPSLDGMEHSVLRWLTWCNMKLFVDYEGRHEPDADVRIEANSSCFALGPGLRVWRSGYRDGGVCRAYGCLQTTPEGKWTARRKASTPETHCNQAWKPYRFALLREQAVPAYSLDVENVYVTVGY